MKYEYIGKKFGRLTPVELVSNENYNKKFRCKCDCGNEVVVFAGNLTRGHTTSCGCLKQEIIEAGAHTTHGYSRTRLYKIWKGMRKRCTNAHGNRYDRYGGRGIEVCGEWENFESFREWAMANGYSDELSIDRVDNDKGYYPENCKWSTAVEQSNNRSTNHFITVRGETHTIAEWSRIVGISQERIAGRLRLGWSEERAVMEPLRV